MDFDQSYKGKQLDKGTKDDGTDLWEDSVRQKGQELSEEVFEQEP